MKQIETQSTHSSINITIPRVHTRDNTDQLHTSPTYQTHISVHRATHSACSTETAAIKRVHDIKHAHATRTGRQQTENQTPTQSQTEHVGTHAHANTRRTQTKQKKKKTRHENPDFFSRGLPGGSAYVRAGPRGGHARTYALPPLLNMKAPIRRRDGF